MAPIRHALIPLAIVVFLLGVATVDTAHAQTSNGTNAADSEAATSGDASTVLDEGLVADEASSEASDPDAYTSDDAPRAEPSRFPPRSHYDVGFAYQFDSDVEDGGDFDMWRAFVHGVYDVDMTKRFAIVTRFDYNADVYSFDDAPPVGANNEPLLQWGTVNTPRLEPLAAFPIGDAWRVYVGPVLEFSFESGANIREGFRPGGLAAAEWLINDDLRVGLGVIGTYDLDSTAYISPILLLDWRLTDSLAVHMESWSTRGGDIELGWRPLEQLELAASVGFQREYFRLNERTFDDDPDNLPPPQDIHISNGLVRDRNYTAALRASWLPQFRFVEHVFGELRIDLDVAAVFAGEFTIEDEDGSELSKQTYDAAPSIGLSFRVPL